MTLSTIFRSVRAKFLACIGVAIALVIGISLLALLEIERNDTIERNREDRRLALEQLGNTLERPLWNLEEMQINDVLAATVRDRRFLCLRLDAELPFQMPAQYGDCSTDRPYEVMKHAVTHAEAGTLSTLGTLIAHVDVNPEGKATTRQLIWRVLLLASALLVTLLVVDWTFRRIVDRPLGHVRRSLREYQERGERRAIDWSSRDELGSLIEQYNASLALTERAEAELRAARDRAEAAFDDLARAQSTLAQSEKMASLGRLVAGVAHEINTPVGIAVTVSSTLSDRCRDFRQVLVSNTLRRSTLEEFMTGAEEASALIGRSLANAHDLLQSFKQVSADQTSEVRRAFDLAEVVQEVATTLRPRLKRTPHSLSIDIPPGIRMESYPGPLGQVVTNLVNNALLHAFGPEDAGSIRIAGELEEGCVVLRVGDDGQGIPPENIGRIFDPFFTTKLGAGGTGLGLSLVYNIVTQTLGGEISVLSRPDDGTCFKISIPVCLPPARPASEDDAEPRSPCHA